MRPATPLLLALTLLTAGLAHAQVECRVPYTISSPGSFGAATLVKAEGSQGALVISSAPALGTGLLQADTFVSSCPDGWGTPQQITPPPPTFRFGAYMAAASNPTGSYLAVGAPFSQVGGTQLAGAAYIYRFNDSPPFIEVPPLQQIPGSQPLEGVGSGVAFDSETDMRFLAVGAAGPEERGVMDIFRFNAVGETFNFVTRLESGLPAGSAPTTNFGSVALVRDADVDFMTAFLAAFDAFHGYGVVAVTSPDGGITWDAPDVIILGEPDSQCDAGPKVTAASAGQGVLMPAVGCPGSGNIVVGTFKWEDDDVQPVDRVLLPGLVPSEIRRASGSFASSPPPGGDAQAATPFILAAGDPAWDGQTGRVHLYRVLVEPDGSDLSAEELAVITASDGEPFDRFGAGASLSEDARWLLVGAPGKDFNAGAAYLYEIGDLVVASEPEPESAAVTLSAAPNPFRDRAQVTLTLDRPEPARVAVFDALGREVALLHDGPLAAGRHPLALDGRGLPAGVYLIRASGEGFGLTRRVTLLR